MPRAVVAVGVGVLLAVASTPAAIADTQAGQITEGGGVTVIAGGSNSNVGTPGAGGSSGPTAGGGGGGGPVPTCSAYGSDPGVVTYTPLPPDQQAAFDASQPHSEPGTWYIRSCGAFYAGVVWLPSGSGPGAPPVDPVVLAHEALDHLGVPTPTVALTPPADKVLVNAPVWLSIDPAQWSRLSATASAAGVTSTAVGDPDKVVWDMGDGNQVTCAGPGTPYDPAQDYFAQQPDCGYVYRRSSAGQPGDAVSVTATLYYHATWSASGAAGGGDLGDISATSAPLSVRVNEIQTVVVPGGRP